MENRLFLGIITPHALFARTLGAHLGLPCRQLTAQESVAEDVSALLYLPESLRELMEMEALAQASPLPALLLVPEDAGRAQPQCRSLQRPVSLTQLKQEVNLLVQQPRKLRWAGLGEFDPTGMHLHNLFGQSAALTEKEASLLTYLASRTAPSREEIMQAIWGYHPDAETHTLDTHLYRLRQKLQEIFGEKLQIHSHEAGYCLIIQATAL